MSKEKPSKEFYHCDVCKGKLSPGQTCSACGASRMSVSEELKTLHEAVPQPFKQFADKFSESVQELTAMIDLNFRINYKGTQGMMDNVVRRIDNGEFPSNLLHEVTGHWS